MSKIYQNKTSFGILSLLIISVYIYIIFFYDGTIDDGDSVYHYLYSRYAWKHPHLWIDHWNKPLFTMLSAPFALLGFVGMKFFNTITSLIAIYYTYLVVRKLEFRHSEWILPILAWIPGYLIISQSGLTETLFSCLSIASFYYLISRKIIIAFITASFLPFSRPEGIFIILIYLGYSAIFLQNWKSTLWLVTGHIFYIVIGMLFFQESWHWVFSKNPNANLQPFYNTTGQWSHYINGLKEINGSALNWIFWIGVVLAIFKFRNIQKHKNLLTAFVIIGFIVGSHTFFWKFGLFKSFGLTRNLLTVAPFMSLFILLGFESIIKLISLKVDLKSEWKTLIIFIFLIINLLNNEKPFSFFKNFELNETQKLSKNVAQYIHLHYPNYSKSISFYPYLSYLLNEDVIDTSKHENIDHTRWQRPFPSNSIIIWDDWYSLMEGKISLEQVQMDKRLRFVQSWSQADESNKLRSFYLFVPIETQTAP